MKGTEKQITYARDILAKTTEKVNETVETLIQRNTVPGYGLDVATQKRINRYQQAKALLSEENWENASDVIEAHKGWKGLFELVVHYVTFPEDFEN